MRLIVTGASGFVGQHLVRFLAGRYELVCLARDPSTVPDLDGLLALPGDLAGREWAARLPERADAIIHLAQSTASFPEGADDLFAINVGSTQRLASYALRAGVRRFILASSGSVYRAQARPLRETDAVEPPNFYATTKAISEMILRPYEDSFGVSVMRLFAPYGPGQVDRMIPRLIASVREGRPITLYNGGQPRLNPIHVSDLVQIVEDALDLQGSQTVNVAGPGVVGVGEIAWLAAKALGREPILIEEARAAGGDLVADTNLMRRVFGPRNLIHPSAGIPALVKEIDARVVA